MSYKLEFQQSPNYTPGSQTQYFYGRPRTIEFGAGHWWDDPSRGPSHQGVVNTFMNPARQASAHAVLSAGRVTEMVRQGDVSWATNNANPYTFSIEVDPRITVGGAQAEAVMATLAEYIADKGFHNLQWYPHKKWWSTACNPIDWGEVMRRAKKVVADRNKPKYSWRPMQVPRKLIANGDIRPLNLDNGQRVGDVIKKGTPIEFATATEFNGSTFLRSKYSTANNLNYGIEMTSLKELSPEYVTNDLPMVEPRVMAVSKDVRKVDLATMKEIEVVLTKGTEISFTRKTKVGNTDFLRTKHDVGLGDWKGIPLASLEEVVPEWAKNLDDITDVKLMVLPAAGTPIYELNSGKEIGTIAKGTWVDIAKQTKVGGQTYLISKYSVENVLPNGVKIEDLGVPVEPPKLEKPEWLEKWEDITDVVMYARVKTPLVNLMDGSTIKEIEINTPIEIASATTWHGQKYLITKYSTDKKEAAGIPLANLNMEEIKEPETPAEPVPDKSTEELIKENNSILKMILEHFGIKSKE